MRFGLLGVALVVMSFGVSAEVVDLSLPFTCPDVSPTPMRISEKGLVMGGILYPLVNPNASISPVATNALFGSKDGLSEIDVIQYGSGVVDVSYMKYVGAMGHRDDRKIFERASYGIENSPAYFHSKNQGCRN